MSALPRTSCALPQPNSSGISKRGACSRHSSLLASPPLPKTEALGPCPPWSCSPGWVGTSSALHLCFHSATCGSTRIPVPEKKHRNSLNKRSKQQVNNFLQGAEHRRAYLLIIPLKYDPQVLPITSRLFFSTLLVRLFLVNHRQLKSATVSSKS